jgi:DNA-binding transcriptional LysR family regulator
VLVAISRHGNLTATAVALHMSQPAVSKWLLDIEAALGVRLFVRGRRLRPTACGEALLRHAERMLGEAHRMHEEIEAIHEGASGILRIGTMGVAAPVLLPRAIHRLRSTDSALRIVLIEDIAVGLWPRFERNELDLIVGRLDEHPQGSAFQAEPLYVDQYCVIAGPKHPLAQVRKPTWAQAAGHPWVLPPAQTPLRRAIAATFISEGLAPPRPWLESVSFTANQVFLRESACLGISSRAVARHYQSLGVLKALPLHLTSDIASLSMVWRDPNPSPIVARALEALRTVAREMPGSRH